MMVLWASGCLSCQTCGQSAQSLIGCLVFPLDWVLTRCAMFQFNCHESRFSESDRRIKSKNITFERVFKAQHSWNVCFMVDRKFAPKIPEQFFAYLITKVLCLIYTRALQWEAVVDFFFHEHCKFRDSSMAVALLLIIKTVKTLMV